MPINIDNPAGDRIPGPAPATNVGVFFCATVRGGLASADIRSASGSRLASRNSWPSQVRLLSFNNGRLQSSRCTAGAFENWSIRVSSCEPSGTSLVRLHPHPARQQLLHQPALLFHEQTAFPFKKRNFLFEDIVLIAVPII